MQKGLGRNIAGIVWILILVLLLRILLPAVYAAFSIPPSLAEFAAEKLHRPDLLQQFSARLTPAVLLAIRLLLVLVGLCMGFAAYWWMPLPGNQRLANMLKMMVNRCQRELAYWKALPPSVKIALLMLAGFYLATRLYMLLTVPLERDESMSYYYFIKPGPLVATTYYPYPNNHPLYSLWAWLFSGLPLPVVWKIRLPALVMGWVAIWLAFRVYTMVLRRRVLAILCVAMLISLFPFGRFSVYGRGYLLQLAIALLLLLFYLRALRRNEAPPWFWVALLHVFGFYTLPTFLYFSAICLPFMGWLFWQRKLVSLQTYLLHALAIGAMVVLLYLPFIITCGGWQAFKAVVYSGYSPEPVWSLAESLAQGKRGWNIFLLRPREELTAYGVLVAATLGLLALGRRRGQWLTTAMAITLLWLPMLAHLWQRHYIPERAFSFAIILLPLGLVGIGWFWQSGKLRLILAAAMALVFSLNYSRYFLAPNYPFGQERTLDASAAIFAQTLLNSGADTIYLHDGWYRPVIEMYFHEAGRPLTVYTNSTGSPNYRVYKAADHYDAVIIRSHTPLVPATTYRQKMMRPDAILYRY